jgi:hypothetical protein
MYENNDTFLLACWLIVVPLKCGEIKAAVEKRTLNLSKPTHIFQVHFFFVILYIHWP